MVKISKNSVLFTVVWIFMRKERRFFKKLFGKCFTVFISIRGSFLSSICFNFKIYLENVHLKREKCSQNFAFQPLPISPSFHHCTALRKVKRSEFVSVWIFQNSLFCDSVIYRIARVKSFPETEEIWWGSSRKKVLYIYSANGDPQWFQEAQVIPIIGQVCCQENKMLRNKKLRNKMLRNKMLRMHLGIQESKWSRRNLILDDFTKQWCDPSVSVTTHALWEAIPTDSKWSRRENSNMKFLSEHLLDLTQTKLSLGKEQDLSSLVSGVVFLQKYSFLGECTWCWCMLEFRTKVLILAVWFSAELTNTRAEVKTNRVFWSTI